MTFEEGELSIYFQYRDTTTTTEWVEASTNPEYERHLMEEYDRSFHGQR